jgi:hypothetical protein
MFAKWRRRLVTLKKQDTLIQGVARWLLLFLVLFSINNAALAQNDVTAHIEHLGNPLHKKYRKGRVYARNVWDLQAYDGRLYIGGGNSSNLGPARNAGPVPLMSWDPVSKRFTQEFIVDDEQIDVYYVFGQRLYTPGHDPRESWELGNFYRREPNGLWKKYRNIPQGIHTYAMHSAGGLLFAGLGVRGGAAVAISRDEGKTWVKTDLGGRRIHAFLEAATVVCATDVFFGPETKSNMQTRGISHVPVHEFDGKETFVERPDLTASVVFPGFELQGYQRARVIKPVSWRAGSAYIGGYCHNDHQFMPFGLYFIRNFEKTRVDIRKFKLPRNEKIWDILANSDSLFVLVSSRQDNGQLVRVVETRDFENASEVLRFKAATFARSFELLDGDFYFGLGCEVQDPHQWNKKELHPMTGEIIRVKAKHFSLCTVSQMRKQMGGEATLKTAPSAVPESSHP